MNIQDWKDYIEDYINEGPINKRLLKEILDYNPNCSIYSKANRIYRKCIRYNHLKWATRIAEKYEVNEIKDDLTIAASFSLLAQKAKK